MKMNSSRLRSAIAAPKLAITSVMALPCRRSRLNSSASSASASSPVRTIASDAGDEHRPAEGERAERRVAVRRPTPIAAGERRAPHRRPRR